MPNLEEFQAGTGAISVSDRGAETFAQAGRRAGVAFNEVGHSVEKVLDTVHQHQVDMDVGNTLTAQSTAEVNAHNLLMQLVNDPRAAEHPELGIALLDQYRQTQNDIAGHATTDEGKRAGTRAAAERIDQFSQRVASEMSILAGNKAVQNVETYTNNSAAMATDDPSRMANLAADVDQHLDQVTPKNLSPEGVGAMDKARMQAKAKIYMSGYLSGIHTGEQQLATGRPGVALDAIQKMLDAGIGMDVIGDSKAAIQEKIDQARVTGPEQNQRRIQFGDQQAKRDGDDAYAQIDAQLEPYKHTGQTPPPALTQAIRDYTLKYGRTNAEQAHGLNELLSTVTDPNAQYEKAGATLTGAAALEQRILTGDRTVDENALNLALAAGAKGDPNGISIEQYKVMKGLLPPKGTESSPAMRQAMTQLNQRITELTGSLPQGQSRGTVAAILRHDMTAAFEGWAQGQFKDDPLKALDVVTNINNPHNAIQLIQNYRNAVNQPDPGAYLKQRLQGFAAAGYGAAEGSVISPLTGPTDAAPQPDSHVTVPLTAGAPAPVKASTGLSPERLQALSKLAGGH